MTLAASAERIGDVVIVGAGPAGMAAAVEAARSREVLLVDDNASAGGQIWRGLESKQGAEDANRAAGRWFAALQHPRIQFLRGARVFAGDAAKQRIFAETADGLVEISYRDLILATGARELFLPFPGWTLPNVMGAGGLQAMVKAGLPIAGKRVLIAGSGPLLLAIADYLRKQGAQVVGIAEQASTAAIRNFGLGLLRERHLAKLARAIALKARLRGIPYWTDTWPLGCRGDQQLQAVTLRRTGCDISIDCDYFACGFGLVPNLELAWVMGCCLADGVVAVDEHLRTSVNHIYCVGESTGIGGVEKSLAEGSLAGWAEQMVNGAAPGTNGNDHDGSRAAKIQRQWRRSHDFATLLNRAFTLRPEMARLADSETIVCRCEDVTLGRIQNHANWREAKLHTRCGMGPCQGRICGAALSVMRGWQIESIREPIFPVSVSTLAQMAGQTSRPIDVTADARLFTGD